jgi:hypothetical protein
MAVSFADGRAVEKGRPVVVVAATWQPVASAAKARAQARELAELGLRGLWVPSETAASDIDTALDAARRAGLAALVADQAPAAPHVLASARRSVELVTDSATAFSALCSGCTLVAGPLAAVRGLARFVNLADDAAQWAPRLGQGSWRLTGAGDELAGFSPRGEPLTLAIPAHEPPLALHWIEPETGDILGLVTPEPGAGHVLEPHGAASAFYLGPNRWQPDESDAWQD